MITVGLSLLVAAALPVAEPQWKHQPQAVLALSVGERPVFAYRFAKDEGTPCFHPLAVQGHTMTELSPADHAWHRALWFVWKYVNDANFWDWTEEKKGVITGKTRLAGQERFTSSPAGGVLEMNLEYVAAEKVLLAERRVLAMGLPRDDGSYSIDWQMTFTAPQQDALFERTPPEKFAHGGYAGLSYRAAKMRDVQVLDGEGRKDMAGHGKPARWMDLSGTLDPQGPVAGLAMFDHPSNPRHPTPWFIVMKGFAYINPAFLFAEPYTLPAGKSLTLRYRVFVHPGRPEVDRLEKEYEAFKGFRPAAVPTRRRATAG